MLLNVFRNTSIQLPFRTCDTHFVKNTTYIATYLIYVLSRVYMLSLHFIILNVLSMFLYHSKVITPTHTLVTKIWTTLPIYITCIRYYLSFVAYIWIPIGASQYKLFQSVCPWCIGRKNQMTCLLETSN